MPGDTRITACYVEKVKVIRNKDELFKDLVKELPGFIEKILSTELPKPDGRLNIPVIDTGEKEDQQEREEKNEVILFINENCVFVPGHVILYSEFYERMVTSWTQIKVGRNLPPQHPKGMRDGSGQMYVGNIGWKRKDKYSVKTRLQRVGKRLRVL